MPVVLVEKQTPQIRAIVLNRPERRNALTLELLNELNAAIKVASEQPQERVLILRGAGAAFCTGLDLKEGCSNRATSSDTLSGLAEDGRYIATDSPRRGGGERGRTLPTWRPRCGKKFGKSRIRKCVAGW